MISSFICNHDIISPTHLIVCYGTSDACTNVCVVCLLNAILFYHYQTPSFLYSFVFIHPARAANQSVIHSSTFHHIPTIPILNQTTIEYKLTNRDKGMKCFSIIRRSHVTFYVNRCNGLTYISS